MKSLERKAWIADRLSSHGRVQVEEVAEILGVSKMTIYRDIDSMALEGAVRKIRGGASMESSALFESDFRFRQKKFAAQKSEVASIASTLIEPGMTVMINDGSTGVEIAAALTACTPLTIITNNVGIFERVGEKSGFDIILTGGNYLKKYHALHGIVAENAISQIRADVCFISTAAVDSKNSYSRDQNVVRVKQKMIKSSKLSYLTVTSNKFYSSALHQVAPLREFDMIITDSSLNTNVADELRAESIELMNELSVYAEDVSEDQTTQPDERYPSNLTSEKSLAKAGKKDE